VLPEIFLAHLAAVASPGPNALLVTHTAVARSRRASLWCAAGVAAGALVWAGAVSLGLGLLLDRAGSLPDVLRALGGCYLIFLGVSTLRSASEPQKAGAPEPSAGSAADSALRGALTNLSNPKAAIFYVSILGSMLPADAPAATRCLVVGVIAVNTLLWYGMLGLAFSTRRAEAGYVVRKRAIDRACGAILAVLGGLLLAG
jgi:threonine/homoserine/homoserine lactone efflux protein